MHDARRQRAPFGWAGARQDDLDIGLLHGIVVVDIDRRLSWRRALFGRGIGMAFPSTLTWVFTGLVPQITIRSGGHTHLGAPDRRPAILCRGADGKIPDRGQCLAQIVE